MTTTPRGALPSTLNDASRSGSADSWARPVDPQRAAGTRDQKQQGNPGIAHDVAQRIHPVVAAAVGHHQRLFIVNPHETRQVATRRAIQPLRAAGGECREG
jgi:hypothetical protein